VSPLLGFTANMLDFAVVGSLKCPGCSHVNLRTMDLFCQRGSRATASRSR